jgi:hypothetical protein
VEVRAVFIGECFDMLTDDSVATHEASHAVAAWACGLPIDSVTITPAADYAGSLVLTPNNIFCKRLHEFSSFALHDIRCPPLPKIVDGKQPLGAETAVLIFAKAVVLLAGTQGEKLFHPHRDAHGRDRGDMLAAKILACNVSANPKAFLDCATADAARIVIENRHHIERLAAALIEHRTLDAADIADIVTGRNVFKRKLWGRVIESATLFKLNHGGLERRL